MKKTQVDEKRDRKTLSTYAHIILAKLMEEESAYERGRAIIAVMKILKEME